MYTLLPSSAAFLFHRTACKIKPGLIKKGAELVHAGHPDHDRSRVCQVPEALFAFPQCGFSLLTLSDIREQAEDPNSISRMIENRHGGNADPYRRSIGAAEAKI